MLTVGVLALQGDFAKHVEALHSLNAQPKLVRYVRDLQNCDALIIPGGESTTILRHIEVNNLRNALEDFALKKPIFGTCAGLIVMSKKVISDEMHPFEWLNVTVLRNAYGRQYESFDAVIDAHLSPGIDQEIKAVFIRAPKITKIGKGVTVLAYHEEEPILVQQGHFLGASFHPELTEDLSVHKHFLSLI